MSAISTSRRAAAGIAFIVAGALLLLAVVLPLLGLALPWLTPIGFLAISAGLALLALGAVNSNVAKFSLLAASLGWVVLAVAGFGAALPAGLVTFAAVLAALATLVGAIVVYVGKEIKNTPAIAFVVTAVLAALMLFGTLGVLALGEFGTILIALLGIALVVTGVLFRQTERSRR